MKLLELFNKPTNYQWLDQHADYAKGSFMAGSVRYTVQIYQDFTSHEDAVAEEGDRMPIVAPGYNIVWELIFSARVPGESNSRLDNTGTGDQYTVYSTVVAMAKDQMSKFGVAPLYMYGDDKGRQSLYQRMLRKLLPSWKIQTSPRGEIAAIPPAP